MPVTLKYSCENVDTLWQLFHFWYRVKWGLVYVHIQTLKLDICKILILVKEKAKLVIYETQMLVV